MRTADFNIWNAPDQLTRLLAGVYTVRCAPRQALKMHGRRGPKGLCHRLVTRHVVWWSRRSVEVCKFRSVEVYKPRSVQGCKLRSPLQGSGPMSVSYAGYWRPSSWLLATRRSSTSWHGHSAPVCRPELLTSLQQRVIAPWLPITCGRDTRGAGRFSVRSHWRR